MASLHDRLLLSIATMLGAENGYAPESYTWLQRYSTEELRDMMAARQVNTPELFAEHGLYVM